jgi:hypothetical protein
MKTDTKNQILFTKFLTFLKNIGMIFPAGAHVHTLAKVQNLRKFFSNNTPDKIGANAAMEQYIVIPNATGYKILVNGKVFSNEMISPINMDIENLSLYSVCLACLYDCCGGNIASEYYGGLQNFLSDKYGKKGFVLTESSIARYLEEVKRRMKI